MNEIQNFNFNGSQVRALTIDNEPYFVGKDVAEILGYKNPSNALQTHVDKEDKTTYLNQVSGSNYKTKTTIINESGLYSLILSSKLPSAKQFKRWVTNEVLPTIRKHGMYASTEKVEEMLSDPDTMIKTLQALKEERKGRLMAEQQVKELKPKADYCDIILSNKSLVTITQIAKDYGMSGKAMNSLLHDLGVQYRQSGAWLLYSKHQSKGWTQSETKPIPKPDGTTKIVFTTKWTQKGRLGLYELLKKHDVLPLIEQD